MKFLLGIALGLFLLCASVAKADGFDPADVYPGEIVFDFSEFINGVGQIHWSVEVVDTQPQGADFEGACVGPILQQGELKWLRHSDPRIAFEAFKLANAYLFGKPVQAVAGEEMAPPIKIDISAIPTRHAPAHSPR